MYSVGVVDFRLAVLFNGVLCPEHKTQLSAQDGWPVTDLNGDFIVLPHWETT